MHAIVLPLRCQGGCSRGAGARRFFLLSQQETSAGHGRSLPYHSATVAPSRAACAAACFVSPGRPHRDTKKTTPILRHTTSSLIGKECKRCRLFHMSFI